MRDGVMAASPFGLGGDTGRGGAGIEAGAGVD